MSETGHKQENVGIIGSGLIGRSFAMLFAAAGYQVQIYDIKSSQVTDALANIMEQLLELEKMGLLRGNLTVQQQHNSIKGTNSIEDCVRGAFFVMECVPEKLEMKKSVYAEVDHLLDSSAILASSTSALVPSMLSKELKHKNRFIVVHPTNPPFYAPLVELVPAPWTDTDVLPTTKRLCIEIGQTPVVLEKEIDGFVLNRIQYAVMAECWNLIEDDVMDVDDVDKVMSEGLGRRYAFIGPMETAYLNADGWLSYAERYSAMFERITASLRHPSKLEGAMLQKVHDTLVKKIPEEGIEDRRKWRDSRLAFLAKLIKDMNK